MQPQFTKKEAKRHKKYLDSLLDSFFKLLDRKPKPETEEIRTEFINAESAWQLYCREHQLGTRASEMFNAKVSYTWENKYLEPQA